MAEAIAAHLHGVDADDPETVAAAAERLLGDADAVSAALAGSVRALRQDPSADLRLRVSRDALRTGAILWEGAAGTLSAALLDADALAAMPPVETVVASGRLSVTCYRRAGGAALERRAAPDAGVLGRPERIPLADGAVVRLDGRTHAFALEHVRDDVVTLTFTVRAGAGEFVREFDRASGRCIRLAALDERPSRAAMLLTLVRLSGRHDAGHAFDAASRDDAFFLRWHAMREWLALDAAAALPRLAEMARSDPHAEVRTAAVQTLGLVEERRVVCLA